MPQYNTPIKQLQALLNLASTQQVTAMPQYNTAIKQLQALLNLASTQQACFAAPFLLLNLHYFTLSVSSVVDSDS